MGFLLFLDTLLSFFGMIIIVYQIVIAIVGIAAKPLHFQDVPKDKRFAVLISARNEENVIGNLIKSIRANDYPADLLDVWLVADNCTDNTAQIGLDNGAKVIKRNDPNLIGKGYALTYLLNNIISQYGMDYYDAYFVFDADNILDSHYFTEMNKAYQAGFQILTSYRNSTNLSKNWVSSGSALWFIRESRLLNSTRMVMGSSCNVGGTGFMFSKHVMKQNDGWKFHLITEDIEFSLDAIVRGERIGYCGTAILYDEQPITFSQMWKQRLRWAQGFLQIYRYYGFPLLQKILRDGDFAALDMMTVVFPMTLLLVIREIAGFIFAACGFVTWESQVTNLTMWVVGIAWGLLVAMVVTGIAVVIERKRIGATNKELVAFILSFPVFMASQIPISFWAIVTRPKWTPIGHQGVSSADAKTLSSNTK